MKTVTIYFDVNGRALAVNRKPDRFSHTRVLQVEEKQDLLGKFESQIVRETQAITAGKRYERQPVPFGIRHMGIHWITDLERGLTKADQRTKKTKEILRGKSLPRPADAVGFVHPREEERGYNRPVPRAH